MNAYEQRLDKGGEMRKGGWVAEVDVDFVRCEMKWCVYGEMGGDGCV